MSGDRKTWRQVVKDLEERLGRKPTTNELIQVSVGYEMTPEEIEEQRRSWAKQDMD